MVKVFASLLSSFFLLAASGCGAEISVSSEVDSDTLYENQPIRVLVTVTHPGDKPVDMGSFLLGSEPVDPEPLKEVKFSPENPLILSFFRFQIPPKASGLYLLPPVSVKVDGSVYRSIASSYTVNPGSVRAMSAGTPASSGDVEPSSSSASLKLEAFIKGKERVYPGERFKAGYKYTFIGEIDLDKEALPLLDGKGFVKIGEKEIIDGIEGNANIRLIMQLFEAKNPGSYSFGPSVIEGYSYTENDKGKKAYDRNKLISEAPAITVNVIPFPDRDKPASFDGAIGDFSFSDSLASSPDMNVGDEFVIELKVDGTGNLNTVSFYNLCCQPGFSGFFKVSDLPPAEEINGNVKTVKVKMRPMTDIVKEVPSIEFSFFDPAEEHYVVRRSNPLPIKVNPAAAIPVKERNDLPLPAEKEVKEPPPEAKSELIGIMGFLPLESEDLRNLHFGSWRTLALLPLFCFVILYVWQLKVYFERKGSKPRAIDSRKLFENAFALPKRKHAWNQEQLKSAFEQVLAESGLLPLLSGTGEEADAGGLAGEVQALLAEFDEGLFSGKGMIDAEEVYRKAKILYEKIRRAAKVKGSGEAK